MFSRIHQAIISLNCQEVNIDFLLRFFSELLINARKKIAMLQPVPFG
jgi:hypothetical protein